MHVNGLTGQGTYELSTLLMDEKKEISTVKGMKLRFPMPSAWDTISPFVIITISAAFNIGPIFFVY